MMNPFLKVLGIVIAFGGGSMIFYGLVNPIFNPTSADGTQLWIIFGSIILVFGSILIFRGK